MASNWWQRLPDEQRREYERSAALSFVAIKASVGLATGADAVAAALAADDHAATQAAAQALVTRICSQLALPPVAVRVSGVRPHDARGELHGLYTPGKRHRISVWMRTAQRGKVVAPRTFLRTLLHEVCHHIDIEALSFPSSFHTPGFFKRESSLFRTVVRGSALARAPKGAPAKPRRTPSSIVASDAELAAREVLEAARHLGLAPTSRRIAGGDSEASMRSEGSGAEPEPLRGIDLLRATAAAIAARQRRDQ